MQHEPIGHNSKGVLIYAPCYDMEAIMADFDAAMEEIHPTLCARDVVSSPASVKISRKSRGKRTRNK